MKAHMKAQDLIDQLQRLEGPSRRLDGELAQVVGWTKKTENVIDPKTRETRQQVVWFSPTTNEKGTIPRFTLNIQDAFNFAMEIEPGQVGGCSWEPGKGNARINEGPYCQAFSPAVAICIAAMTALLARVR